MGWWLVSEWSVGWIWDGMEKCCGCWEAVDWGLVAGGEERGMSGGGYSGGSIWAGDIHGKIFGEGGIYAVGRC